MALAGWSDGRMGCLRVLYPFGRLNGLGRGRHDACWLVGSMVPIARSSLRWCCSPRGLAGRGALGLACLAHLAAQPHCYGRRSLPGDRPRRNDRRATGRTSPSSRIWRWASRGHSQRRKRHVDVSSNRLQAMRRGRGCDANAPSRRRRRGRKVGYWLRDGRNVLGPLPRPPRCDEDLAGQSQDPGPMRVRRHCEECSCARRIAPRVLRGRTRNNARNCRHTGGGLGNQLRWPRPGGKHRKRRHGQRSRPRVRAPHSAADFLPKA